MPIEIEETMLVEDMTMGHKFCLDEVCGLPFNDRDFDINISSYHVLKKLEMIDDIFRFHYISHGLFTKEYPSKIPIVNNDIVKKLPILSDKLYKKLKEREEYYSSIRFCCGMLFDMYDRPYLNHVVMLDMDYIDRQEYMKIVTGFDTMRSFHDSNQSVLRRVKKECFTYEKLTREANNIASRLLEVYHRLKRQEG